MNKQKINAYLEESLKPWHPTSAVAVPYKAILADRIQYVLSASGVNCFIKNLIKDKS